MGSKKASKYTVSRHSSKIYKGLTGSGQFSRQFVSGMYWFFSGPHLLTLWLSFGSALLMNMGPNKMARRGRLHKGLRGNENPTMPPTARVLAVISAGQGLGTLGHWWSCRLREWSRRVSPGRSEATPQVRHRYGPLGHARKMACPFGRRNGGVRRALRAMKSSARRRSSLVATTGNGGYPGRCGKHRFATTQERRDASPAQKNPILLRGARANVLRWHRTADPESRRPIAGEPAV